MSAPSVVHYVATGCFALAVLHTFSVKYFQSISHKYSEGSVGENLFHLLGEVEVVFGIWAGLFILYFMADEGMKPTIAYLESRNFTEPIFVFVIMTMCASRPILELSEKVIRLFGQSLPLNRVIGFYASTLIVGPILGSFITEPAAMTVTALILLKSYYNKDITDQLRYATLGLLFVNVSIGGTLTPYAAPPVLMVAQKWNWDLTFMFSNFGWKAVVAIVLSTSFVTYRFRKELARLETDKTVKSVAYQTPLWVSLLHLIILFAIVIAAHHMVLFVGIFLFFLGVAAVTKEYHDDLRIREALLVGFFLGGLVILGGYQNWWLEPILSRLTALPLYLGSMSLTAFTDNAAITYLGSQVVGLSDISKYALVAGSVVGGGLTVIANAPNPAGYSTLNSSFGPDGISSVGLFISALIPTIISGVCFWFL
ncbi:MAG: putative Na+/H+ antiporter [Bdellovibrionales bacterium]